MVKKNNDVEKPENIGVEEIIEDTNCEDCEDYGESYENTNTEYYESYEQENVDKGNVEKGNVGKGNAEKGNVEQGNVEKGNDEQGNVEKGDVDKGNVEKEKVEIVENDKTVEKHATIGKEILKDGNNSKPIAMSTPPLPPMEKPLYLTQAESTTTAYEGYEEGTTPTYSSKTTM